MALRRETPRQRMIVFQTLLPSLLVKQAVRWLLCGKLANDAIHADKIIALNDFPHWIDNDTNPTVLRDNLKCL